MAISESGRTAAEVARNVERVRKARQLKQKDVSDRLREIGRPMLATVLSKIERGERRVDVDDLMALSIALDVNPSALLLPDTAEGTVELTGSGPVDAKTVWRWADGFRPLHMPEDDDGTASVDFQRHARPSGVRRFGVHGPGRQALREELGGPPFRRRGNRLIREWPDGRVEEINLDELNDD